MNAYNLQNPFIANNLLIGLILIFSASTLQSQSIKTTEGTPDPYMTFETPLHDFGIVKKGEVKTHVFKFVNTGKEDITIEFVTVGCECTELEWPEMETFKPGEGGEIKATYDSNKEEELGEHDKYFEVILLNKDPKTGYQIIREANFKVNVVEK